MIRYTAKRLACSAEGGLTVTAWLPKDGSVAGMVKSSGMNAAPTAIVTLAAKVPNAGTGTVNKVEKGSEVEAPTRVVVCAGMPLM